MSICIVRRRQIGTSDVRQDKDRIVKEYDMNAAHVVRADHGEEDLSAEYAQEGVEHGVEMHTNQYAEVDAEVKDENKTTTNDPGGHFQDV